MIELTKFIYPEVTTVNGHNFHNYLEANASRCVERQWDAWINKNWRNSAWNWYFVNGLRHELKIQV